MLSRIAAITLIDEYTYPDNAPTAWATDHIDSVNLPHLQQSEFADEWVEAQQNRDDSPFAIKAGLLYSLAEPHKNAGRYPRLMLPHVYPPRPSSKQMS